MSRGTASRLTLAVLASLVIALLAAVPAAAKPGGPLSPDARDAALAAEQSGTVDLRSPDARDAARGVQPAPAPSTSSSDASSDWAYLAVGGGLALVLIAGGTVAVVRRRHRAERPAVA
jgi:hypothetical protein